ncbi:MAG: carboxypeptidase-like regulatory domain-containing protein, partial [Chitinophagaceae bacterium]|nr:carboxypeptidase-like regulatory domain-containing protein [Chitinophagaceae bacterium]
MFVLICTLSLFVAQAQSINVSGQVKDETGRPLEGVSVLIKGKTTGTQSNADGKFSLTADNGSILVFTSVGFAKAELPASDDMQVTLKVSTGVGDEVIVVGYGTQRKVNNTGSVSSVGSKLIENRPVTNPSNALT